MAIVNKKAKMSMGGNLASMKEKFKNKSPSGLASTLGGRKNKSMKLTPKNASMKRSSGMAK